MKTLSAALFLCIAAPCAQAQVTLGKATTIVFAAAEEGKEILTRRDDFVERMSPFDRASRMKTDKEVSEKEYLEFAAQNVLTWNDAEKQKITSAIEGVQKQFNALSLPLPQKVFIVKTTGREEGGAAYTRSNAVVLPEAQIRGPAVTVQKLICHELFHIMTRANPELREKLYATIGFVKCDEVAFPPGLRSRKITNPDAPRNDHTIRLQVEGKEHWAIPILFSSAEKYDLQRGGEFFNYLQFRFLLVERSADSLAVTPMHEGQEPMLASMQQVSGFSQQVGNNTGYIIHPEEILADNFALLVLRQQNLPSPEIVKKMEGILREARVAEPRDPAGAGETHAATRPESGGS